jgi:hypothetical protein
MLTGSTPDGTVKGGIRAVRVLCESSTSGSTTGVLLLGIITAGTTHDFIDMFGGDAMFSFFLVKKDSQVDQNFASAGPVTVTVRSHGAHFDAVATEAASESATPHTIHVSGSVTCGTSVTP